MLPLRIALRFLARSPGQSALIIGGIAVGIAVQVFVGSLITSLQTDLVDQTIGSSPHLTVAARDEGDPITYDERLRELAGEPGVTAAVPQRTVQALYVGEGETRPLALKGGELRDLDGIYRLRSRTVEGRASLSSDEVLVGREFAEETGLGPGDALPLRLPNGRTASLDVAGVFDLGAAPANERTAFVSGDFAAPVLGYDSDEYSALEVQLDEPFRASSVAARWRKDLPAADEVTDWQAENADLLQALSSQSVSSYLIQVFVLVAVALGIASTLAISAVQKTRQVGILKALGMTDRGTGLIFLWEGGLLGVAGTAAGVGLGLALIAVFTLAGPASLFEIRPEPRFIAISAGVGIGVALASAIAPQRRTSRLDPIEVIQGA